MLDTHTIPKDSWGVAPYLKLGTLTSPSYSLFVLLGLLAGIGLYQYEMRNRRSPHNLTILVAALIGGILGAKLPYVATNLAAYLHGVRDLESLFAGRTILGGLLGGTLSVMLVKRRFGIQQRNGDYMVTGICVGLTLGRIGCLLRGCCYGKQTTLPWGVDFGDGIPRHPTEIYEVFFVLAWLLFQRGKRTERGTYFTLFMLAYFSFRFLNEFLRTEQGFAWGLTQFQCVCLLAVSWLLIKLYYGNKRSGTQPAAGGTAN